MAVSRCSCSGGIPSQDRRDMFRLNSLDVKKKSLIGCAIFSKKDREK